VHWVRSQLVGQVAFTEWTRDGQLRHPGSRAWAMTRNRATSCGSRPRYRGRRAIWPPARMMLVIGLNWPDLTWMHPSDTRMAS
jgi:hypothetical protein